MQRPLLPPQGTITKSSTCLDDQVVHLLSLCRHVGCQRGERTLFHRSLALVRKSVEVTVNAGPLEVGDLIFSSYWSQDHRVPPIRFSWKFFSFFSVFPNWNCQYPDLILGLSFCLEEAQNRGSEIRGAVHRGPRMKAWPSVMSKVLVTEEALDIGQTERMRNQRI